MKRRTTEQFIEKARQVHGDRYNYSLTHYIDSHIKVKIICKEHGIFEQRACSHLEGNNCKKCVNIKQTATTEQFIEKARQVHGDRYDYSLTEYINNHSKIKIICPTHGVFEQNTKSHLTGSGCKKCWYKNTDILYLKQNLTIEEEPVKIDGEIQCKCAYCKEYFIPTILQLNNRINSLSGKYLGESRLYCSDRCKELCPIYNQRTLYKYQSNNKSAISRPDQSELRRIVLERDNNQCQRCGSSKDLHCHHITGVEINPVESADIDNCITLCYTCHSKVHSSDRCDVKRQPCVV